ncbi:MAG: hypothetical protein AAFV37_02045 [Pseudomonadota bacterium]
MEDKREDLTSEKQRVLLERIVADLSASDPNFYYQSTSDIAYLIKDFVGSNKTLNVEDREILLPLTARDIQLLLSIR